MSTKDIQISPEALGQMQARGGKWAAYQNQDLSHPDCGDVRFLQHGEGRTCPEPPPRFPDTPNFGIGWRYSLVGEVNLIDGTVEELGA